MRHKEIKFRRGVAAVAEQGKRWRQGPTVGANVRGNPTARKGLPYELAALDQGAREQRIRQA